MGLDIYLYKRVLPREKIDADQAELDKFSDKTWHFNGRKYEDLTQGEKDYASASVDAIAKCMGYESSYSTHPGDIRVQAPPSKWPEHICKLDYLRSSYNRSGLNSCLERLGVPTLYEIFAAKDDASSVDVDWNASKQRAEDALVQYRAVADGLDIEEVRHGLFEPSKFNEGELLELARKELLEKPDDGFGAWENKHGTFIPEGMKLVAFMEGKPGFLGSGIYLVTKRDLTPETDWTAQALEIVIEMCDWVLSQPNSQSHYFHWSG